MPTKVTRFAVRVTLGPKGRNIDEAKKAEALLRNRTRGTGRIRAMTVDGVTADIEEALYPNKSA